MKMNSCFECESTENLIQHHVVPKIVGGTKTITLCVDCHGKVHGKNLVKMTELIKESRRRIFEYGRRATGTVPFGYKNDPDKYPSGRGDGQFLIIDEKNAEIVKYIFYKYHALSKRKRALTKTKKTQRLLKLLKKKGYKTSKDKEFKGYNLSPILDNEFYIGYMRFDDKRVKHIYPTFISTRIFNLCKEERGYHHVSGKRKLTRMQVAMEKVNEDTPS